MRGGTSLVAAPLLTPAPRGTCPPLPPPPQSPLVFAHNDLLSGNIMVPLDRAQEAEAARMTFIDFESADWAPRGYDLANHFCE